MLIVLPSGITNTVTRLTVPKTQEGLNQTVIVERRLSAGGGSPEQCRALVESRIQKWDDVIWQTGIKPDQQSPVSGAR